MKAIAKWIRESNLIEGVDDVKEDRRSQLAWNWFIKEEDLCVHNILELHRRIMKVKLGDEAGKFRTCKVFIAGRQGAPWSHLPMLMGLWCRKWRLPSHIRSWQISPRAGFIQDAHVDFEELHPFIDGNGRTGRMILNWQRVKAGLEPLLIEAENRSDYYAWFKGDK